MRHLCWALIMSLCATLTAAAEPVGIIFDTDMGNDVDDALALGMLHALHTRQQCRLLAVTLTKDHRLAGPYVDAVNTFYGHGDVPIGVVKNGKTPGDSKFLPLAEAQANGALRYPHKLMDGKDAPDAVTLLRKTLASQPDGSVVIAQVGFSTNLVRLLETPGDDISPLSGKELAAKKVKVLSIMAGAFTAIGNEQRYREYNVKEDIPSAKALVAGWPTPIVWSGFEIGIALPYPHQSILQDYGYVKHHPLAEAYTLYSPPPHDRPTWDLTSVLYGVFPNRGYFGLSPAGTVTVEDDGFTAFKAEENGKHRYLMLSAEQKPRVLEALVQLSSEPPHQK